MSTLPGQASKGEKTKSRYQSLDINNLYRVSRGENLEKQQQKSSSVYIKHGMQSLGKVPNARRAPANLPSLKAEHSGSDAAVPLVPPGAQGWGKQDSNTSQQSNTPSTHTPPQNSTTPSSNSNQQATPQISSHQAAIALPVTTTIPPHPHKQLTPTAQPVPTDKLWSSVMSNQEPPHPPLYQSPQFQHEFPSLSAGDGGPTRTGSDTPQYPSGLSLRPQTEGSWTQGGQRPVGIAGAENTGVARPGSAHQGAPPQLSVQVGQQQQQQPFPPQIRGVMPSFMCKGSNFQQPAAGIGIQNPPTSSMPINGRSSRPVDNRPPRLADRDTDEVVPRPIIKEEELSRMDEISKDVGWAESDEIDYNQKLAFSDEEGEKCTRKDVRKQHREQREERSESHNVDNQRQWSGSRSSTSRGRSSEEEDIWMQRRSQTDKEVEIAVQKAKQRKEEEEKRFNEERKKGCIKKLLELEEKIQKRDRDNQEGIGTINPNTIPPKPINYVDIPLPDFHKEKERDKDTPRERDNRSRTPIEHVEEKSQSSNQGSSFRQLTQIEGKNFPTRKHTKPLDRDSRDNREQNGPSFSKQFKEDLPPRFLKHQRNNSNSNLQNQQQQQHQQTQQQQVQYHQQTFDNRWASNNQNNVKHQSNTGQNLPHNRTARQESIETEREEERKDYKRQSSEDSFRGSYHSQDTTSKSQETVYQDEGREVRHQGHHDQQFNRREQEERNNWQKDVDKSDKKQEHMRPSHEDWSDKREKHRDDKSERYDRDRERQQRPPDNRSSRHSRDPEPRNYMGSWAESAYEPPYEEKRREHVREDRRVVPGPITKDRIEADDMRNEKRNLTQLKRGQPVEVKSEIKKQEKDEEQKKDPQFISAWADAIPPALEELQNKALEEKKIIESQKTESKPTVEPIKKLEKIDDYNQNRNRPYSQKKGWGNVQNDYHGQRGQPWQRRPLSRGQKAPGRGSEYHGTDSDGSAEDHLANQKSDSQKIETTDQISPKPARKSEKDDKYRENRSDKYSSDQRKQEKPDKRDGSYVPRGEPSRHGRGGGNFRSGRMGGMGKRIDGYGPPPAKSPFGGHHEERDKKASSDEATSSENLALVEDKTKQNQQALAAGIIGKRTDPTPSIDDKNKAKNKPDIHKNKPKVTEKVCDTNSENSDDKNKDVRKAQGKPLGGNRPTQNLNRSVRNNPPPLRVGGDKRFDSNRSDNVRHDTNRNDNTRHDTNRSDGRHDIGRSDGRHDIGRNDNRHDTNRNDNRQDNSRTDNIRHDNRYESRHETNRTDTVRQNSSSSLKKDEKPNEQNALPNAISDISKNRDVDHVEERDEKASVNGDSEGFQEVKSKKNVKERQKSVDDKTSKPLLKSEPTKETLKNDRDRKGKVNSATQMLTQQQIQNIPSLMATPVNPPPVLPQTKNQFDRGRQAKLPPRFAKQKLQKQAMQQQQHQHHGMVDVDMNKVNPNIMVYGMKETSAPPAPVPPCAWDKPLGPQLRNLEHDNMLSVSMEGVKGLEPTHSPSQGISPNNDKIMNKPSQLQDKALLDGTTPPVNTIIFENTNFKSAPGTRGARNDKPRSKLEEGNIDNTVVIAGFNKPCMNELLQSKNDKSDPIQLPLFKEDNVDMKLDFFSADLQFSDDKASKNFVSKSIHAITSGNNTVDSLDYKIASVKKVWETSEQEGEDSQINFGGGQLDSNVFSQSKDPSDDAHEGYSPSPNQSASTTTNVCKVKPTQQVSGSGQTVLSSSGHQQHAGIVAPSLMGNPLSPPPIAPVLGAGVGMGPQYATNQHIGYQAGLTGNTQFGLSAIPSPPTPLVYNSNQQIQAAAVQSAGLYGAFQLDQLGGQGRSQYSQYPNYHGLGQTASSPYSTPNVYLQTAAHHPPPTPQAPPELYPTMNNYRLSAQFGQSQQLNNPTTVLISSTSNSLMSASVKPSSQQISAIGTKAGGVGQAYQQQSQQGQQVFMTYDPSMQANYLASNAGVMQRGPVAPSQNNVVPGLQPSSSFYSGSAGGQTGYFQQPGSSTMPSAQLSQHQAGYGLQGNVFGTHNQSHPNTGMQNYNSHFLTTPMQMAAAINAQQYRSGLPAAYMKGVGSQQMGDQTGRPQQLKSPSSQEVLSSVFNSGPQIPSPKSRQNNKHPPQQSSPTAQHKYNLYQGVGGQQNLNMQRYPTPIQRPVNFQQMQQNMSANQKHRNNPNNKAPNRYYGGQNHSLSGQSEKSDDRKMNDPSGLGSGNPVGTTKSGLGPNTGSAVSAASEKVKDNIKEETAALKD